MRRKKNNKNINLFSLLIGLCIVGYAYIKGNGESTATDSGAPTTVTDIVPTTSSGNAETAEDEDTTSVQAPKGIEIPRFTEKRQSQILVRLAYTASYNKHTRCPNWVAWKLTSDHTDGPYVRKGYRFHEDLDVPYPRAYYEDY